MKHVGGWVFLATLVAVGSWYVATSMPARNAQNEADDVLPDLASRLARCATHGKLPETSIPIPRRFGDVSGKRYHGSKEEWHDAFRCASFTPPSSQRLQYVWEKLEDGAGRLVAIGDLDVDGKPDTWYELPITCDGACFAKKYPLQVLADGTRVPPLLLRWVGEGESSPGVPPSMEPWPEEPPPPTPTTSAKGSGPPALPPLTGAAATLDDVFAHTVVEAHKTKPNVRIFHFEAAGLVGGQVDPARGSTLTARFGTPTDGKRIDSGDVVVVSYGRGGLSVRLDRIRERTRSIDVGPCTARKALAVAGGAPVEAVELSWDVIFNRALWRMSSTNRAVSVRVDGCKLQAN